MLQCQLGPRPAKGGLLMFLLKAVAAATVMSTACALLTPPAQGPQKIDFQQSWSGKRTDRELLKLAPKGQFIADAKTFEQLWSKWDLGEHGDKMPQLDFNKQLVIVVVTNGPNTVKAKLTVDEKQNLIVNASSTLVADDNKTFGYFVGVISREGIEAVNERPLPKVNEKK
jgi:hypothetical protein